MITYRDFAKRGHKLLRREDGRKEVKELFWQKFKKGYEKKDIELIGLYLLHLSEILFKPEEIFFDGVMYHRNKEEEDKVRKEFINFFLKEKVEGFFKLYSVIKKEPQYLYEYLPIIIKFTNEAKPKPKYFVILYLILADTLKTIGNTDTNEYRSGLINLATKGFAKYRVKVEIFEGIIKDEYINKTKEYIETVKIYISFGFYYLKTLNILKSILKTERFNNESALFLIFSELIYKDESYRDLLQIIRDKIDLDLIDNLIKEFELDIDKEILKGNIENILSTT